MGIVKISTYFKMVSKTKIEKRLRQKTDSGLVDTIIKLKKTNPEVAKMLAYPVNKRLVMNLSEIDNKASGKDVFIAGKVLSSGELSKGIKIVAWKVSEKAKEKIERVKGSFVSIDEEIKKNPELKNLEILK